jgi:flagellar protein FliO/FliZ
MMNLFIALFALNTFAADLNQLNGISFEEVNKTPVLTFEFEKPINLANIETRFIRRTIEWDLDATKLKKDKMFINVSKHDVNNVYVSHNDEKSIRIRVNMDNGKTASNYHDRLSYSVDGNKVRMKLDPLIPLIANNIKEISRVYTTGAAPTGKTVDNKTEEHMASVSTMTMVEPTEETPLEATAEESEIPLNIKSAKSASVAAPSLKRAAAGFFVLAILLVSALLVTRKLKAKKAGAAFNHDSITVISQKYLGPKRNLVLIRVTGEYLLLGVTDHNISLIKNLNVVDDEIPELSGSKNFNEVLEKKEEISDMYANQEEDSFSVSSLDDVKKIFKKKRYIDEADL